MVDSIEYEYREELRETRITFSKTVPSGPGGAPTTGGGHVHD